MAVRRVRVRAPPLAHFFSNIARRAGMTIEIADAIGWDGRDDRGWVTLPDENPAACYPASLECPHHDLVRRLHLGSQGSSIRLSVDGLIRKVRGEMRKLGKKGAEAMVLARMPLLEDYPRIIANLAGMGQWDHIFAFASAAASTRLQPSTSNMFRARDLSREQTSPRARRIRDAGARARSPSSSTSNRLDPRSFRVGYARGVKTRTRLEDVDRPSCRRSYQLQGDGPEEAEVSPEEG